MKKYQGQTLEEIEANEDMPEEDKKRMIQLLTLGVSYSEKREVLQDKVEESKRLDKELEAARQLESAYKQYLDPEVRTGNNLDE